MRRDFGNPVGIRDESQHENWDLHEIKGGLIWCKVGFPSLHHQLDVVKGG